MDRNIVGRIKNVCIIGLFVAVILYSALYWAGSPRKEKVKEQAAIEGEAVYSAQKEQEEAHDNVEEIAALPEYFCDIYASVRSAEGTQNIKLYVQNDIGCFFLPSYAQAEETVWQYDESKYRITYNGQTVRNGEKLVLPEQDEAVLVVGPREGEDEEECREYRLRVMRSSHLPAVYIRTDTGQMPAGTWSREEGEQQGQVIGEDDLELHGGNRGAKGNFLCITETGVADSAGSINCIVDREYAGFQSVKKNYEMDFSEAQDVLGLGNDTRWVLQADAYDMSRLRNKTIYDMGTDMGLAYGVRSSYADIWFNGEYAGNYLICRQAGEGKKVCLENGTEGYGLGAADDMTEKEQAYVSTILEKIEQCETQEDYGQLCEVMDMDSFVCKYVLYGLSNEPVLNRINLCYLVPGGTGGKLCAGLELDFDRSLGNAQEAHYERLTCFIPGLGEKLFACEYFRQDVKELFSGQYAPVIERYIQEQIGNMSEQIRASVLMDDVRWGLPENNNYATFNQGYGNFGDAARYTAYYLNARYELMQAYLNEPEGWHQVEYVDSASGEGYDSRRYLTATGEKVPDEVTDYLQEMYGCSEWRYEDGRGCETGRPVYQDLRIISFVEENAEQDVSGDGAHEQGTEDAQTQGTGSTGYSKRFVILCMLFAAGCAGVGGSVFTGVVMWLLFRRKNIEKSTVSLSTGKFGD